jgi:hypothetical protein
MSLKDLEKRVSVLEKEVTLLKQKLEKYEKPKVAWWKEIAGTFADDPVYDEIIRLGREYRLSQREDYDKDED